MNAPASIFIGAAPVQRMVTLADGSEHPFFFREIPNTEFELYAIHSNSADEEVAARASARLVSKSLCNENGEPAITLDQAVTLKRPVLVAMLAHVFEVNGLTTARSRAAAKKEEAAKDGAAKKP